MMKKESKRIEPADRLSELPDSLIFKIFEFLPTRDVVRTPILSSRWKNLSTINPFLYFDIDFDTYDEYRNFVNRALLCWRGARVQKFKVSGMFFDASSFIEMDVWVRFAVDNHVEELDICFPAEDFDGHRVDYCAPKCLYSCSSLQKLKLNCSRLGIKGNVQWNRLKSLEIDCFVVTQHDIDQILCGSPLLEEFILNFPNSKSDWDLSFRSSSLKKLLICKRPRRVRPTVSALRIWTPNLVTLTISGVQFNNYLLMNVSSLARVNLFFCWDDFLRETLSQILPAIQHVEGLAVSQNCVEVLGAMKIKNSVSPFLNVKFLSLNCCFDKYEIIIGIVELFPKLKTLVVDDMYCHADPKSRVTLKPNPSDSFLVELKTVEVTWTRHNYLLVFPFVKILLKHVSKLEKLVFRMKKTKPSNDMLLASEKLLRMPRSSPSANLVFHEY